MTITTRFAVFLLFLLPALHAPAAESQSPASQEAINSRAVFAYYDAATALAAAKRTGKPIFVVSIRGNDCAGGL